MQQPGAISTGLLQSSSATTVMAIGVCRCGIHDISRITGNHIWCQYRLNSHWLDGCIIWIQAQSWHHRTTSHFCWCDTEAFFNGKIAAFVYALAGFGLIFVGISMMQESMSGFEGMITSEGVALEGLA